jgi:hypothetical protein
VTIRHRCDRHKGLPEDVSPNELAAVEPEPVDAGKASRSVDLGFGSPDLNCSVRFIRIDVRCAAGVLTDSPVTAREPGIVPRMSRFSATGHDPTLASAPRCESLGRAIGPEGPVFTGADTVEPDEP